jgi:phosphatidylserine/phosphatidylglycerophosphate/cardiolipin synthase-like enzyme
MNMQRLLPTVHDPDAVLTLLAEEDWLPFVANAVRTATLSILHSVYMISPGCRKGSDLVDELAAKARQGRICCLAIDTPNVSYPWNIQAAKRLAAAGWNVHQVPDRQILHEKLFVIDGELVIVGWVAIRSTEFAARVTVQFWRRWRIGTE